MGIFDIFKKADKSKQEPKGNILLAMPLFTNDEILDIPAVVQHLESFWKLPVSTPAGENESFVATIEGEMVAIAFMPMPVPKGDIESTAAYAYNWPTALQDLQGLTGHAIVSVMSSKKAPLDRFRLLTKILHSILSVSEAVGVYQGSQTLLLSRSEYLASASLLESGKSPVDLWIYLGIRKSEEGNSVYTYGLSAFGKKEMEVVNSSLDIEELYNFLANISAYVINSDVTFKNGETLGYTADQKISIVASKGQFVDGDTLKLGM